jgi:hypothetical protein
MGRDARGGGGGGVSWRGGGSVRERERGRSDLWGCGRERGHYLIMTFRPGKNPAGEIRIGEADTVGTLPRGREMLLEGGTGICGRGLGMQV